MVIGLLGGIGAGKSTVARLLAEAGAEVVDADALAHEALRSPAVRARVAARFGRAVIGPDGEVDRRALAARVFAAGGMVEELNAIVHPPVEERILQRIALHRERCARAMAGPRDLLVLDVPLLAESPLRAHCDALVFVEAGAAVRRQRLRPRGWEEGELERRERLQAPLEEKRVLADLTVNNAGPVEATRGEVARLIEGLRRLGPASGGAGKGNEGRLDEAEPQGKNRKEP